MMKNTYKSLVMFVLLGALGCAVLTSCGNGISTTDSTTDEQTAACTTASCYLASVTDAEWAEAESNMLTMEMEKVVSSSTAGTTDAFEYRWKKSGTQIHGTLRSATCHGPTTVGGSDFDYSGCLCNGRIAAVTIGSTAYLASTVTGKSTNCHEDGPTFIAGKPYVINFVNPVATTNNNQDHYFTAYTGAGGLDFYKGIAVEKVVTPEMVYKMPYIVDFELNKPENNDNVAANPRQTEAKIYFVPVRTGSYEIVCKDTFHSEQTGHTGMVTTLKITSGIDTYPDFELDSGFDTTVWIDDSRRTTSSALPWTISNTLSSTCHGVENGGASAPADYSGCNCNGTVSAGTASSVTYLAGTATGKDMSCTLAPTNIELSETSGAVTITGAPTFKSDLKSNTNGSKSARYQLRFQKASGVTGNYVVSGDLFKNVIVRKIHDRHVQLKPVYLDSMEFLTGASANNVDSGASGDAYTQPGAFEVDLFFIADAQYSITNGTVTGGGSSTTHPVDVSIGTAQPTTTNFTFSPFTP